MNRLDHNRYLLGQKLRDTLMLITLSFLFFSFLKGNFIFIYDIERTAYSVIWFFILTSAIFHFSRIDVEKLVVANALFESVTLGVLIVFVIFKHIEINTLATVYFILLTIHLVRPNVRNYVRLCEVDMNDYRPSLYKKKSLYKTTLLMAVLVGLLIFSFVTIPVQKVLVLLFMINLFIGVLVKLVYFIN